MQKLFYNGNIFAETATGFCREMLVCDGVIRALGEGLAVDGACERIDLAGRSVLPGFVDAHSHLTSVAMGMLQTDLSGCRSVGEVCDALRAAKNDETAFVQAMGYDHNLLAEHRHPTRWELDAALPHTPCVIAHRSGHFGVFNSAAVRALSLETEDGYLQETAFVQAQKRIPMPSLASILSCFERAQRLYASYGVTCVQDGMIVKEMLPIYQALLQSGRLYLDVKGLAAIEDRAAVTKALSQADRHFSIAGYKIILDGSPQGKTAWMQTPYRGGGCGEGLLTDAALRRYFEIALQDKKQLHAHCNGDAAAAQLLRVAGEFDRAAVRENRPVIVHAQLLQKEQLDAVRAFGMIPSFFVAHVCYYGDLHIENFGKARASTISPAGSALQKGILFTFHQDSPVLPPDMLKTIECAVTRTTQSGVLLGKEERIGLRAALDAVTINAAAQYGEQAIRGSLAVGKKADFLITDRDIFRVEASELSQIKILQTFKDGTCIFRREG